jgi:TetR/AcrR family transcriptional repressor of bet genes|tara:strand:- start:2987 stop:3631 length:645 start_codon:yes stop_codon:yes gene_type:complete
MSANTNQKPTTNDKNSEISVNHQKLIDATIETIAKRGLADTTISHVAKKAEVSQGYANFRFKSKENLLLSSLQFLSDEYKKSWQKIFEDENLDPIDRLLRICENDFSKKIANQNKISVWIAFYSEVKFRPSYRSVCQDQDEIYLNQTKKLIDEINHLTNQTSLTSVEISETYHSMVDGLWQRILFEPKVYTNEFCKSLIIKYFKSIYPDETRFQ